MFEPKDILLYESGNGGDIAIAGGDIQTTQQLLQQVYLACFGGNVVAQTTGQVLAGEQRADWWGNSLFLGQNKSKQYNSATEKALLQTPLNSKGRLIIKQAVESDLTYLSTIATVTIEVIINSTNKVTIMVKLVQANQQNSQINFIWDSLKQQVIVEKII